MGHHRFRLESGTARPDAWAALTEVDGLALWTGYDRCLGIAGESFSSSATLECSMSVGDQAFRARVHVLDVSAPGHLALETVTPLAMTREDVRLSLSDGGGTVVEYSLGATSSAHGPAVRVWIARHLTSAVAGLEELLDAEATCVDAADVS